MDHELVVDCSVVMSWCFRDEADAYSERVLDGLIEGMDFAPGILPLEVANALVIGERRKRLRRTDSDRFITLLGELPLTIVPDPPERVLNEAIAIARKHRLSAYDAAYLDLALRRGIPLATRDADLRRAARRYGAFLTPA